MGQDKNVSTETWLKYCQSALRNFFHQETAGGIVLLLCAVLAMVFANTGVSGVYERILDYPLGIGPYSMTVLEWINDGLMAVFFFVVGMEIKTEFLFGELRKPSATLLPVVGALGGMAVPALIYALINYGGPYMRGCGVPVATDIAFSLGVLTFAASKAPRSIAVFLVTLAVADDLGGIVVIALFYNSDLNWMMLGLSAAVIAVLYAFCKKQVHSMPLYIVGGLFLWYLFRGAGIHPTIAGVILGFCIPAARTADTMKEGLLYKLYTWLTPWSSFGIMPLFALSNAGIALSFANFSHVFSPIGLGILLGLCIGKPIGIFLTAFTLIKLHIVDMPAGAKFRHFAGVGILGGIGFTVSLFIASLAFTDPGDLMVAKTAIVCASVIASVVGTLVFKVILHKDAEENENNHHNAAGHMAEASLREPA